MLRASSGGALDEAIRLGKRKLQEGDLDEAEQAFTKALCINGKELRALEGRAVCLERRGNLAKALSDARAMVTAAPSSAQGYLRCAKILRLLNRADDAAGVYQVGLKLVPRSDRLFHELERHCNQLLVRASGNGHCRLPREVLRMVMKHLDDPLRLARTSRALAAELQQLVSSSPELTVGALRAGCLKKLLPGKTTLIVDGPTALKHLLVAVKAGADVHVTECRFIGCDRVDPFELSRAKSLGLLQNLQVAMFVGATSEVLLAVVLGQAVSLQTLLLEDVECTASIHVDLPNLHSLVVRHYACGQRIVDAVKGNPLRVLCTDSPRFDDICASQYTNYWFSQQQSLDAWIDRQAFPSWTHIDCDSPLAVRLDRIGCRKVSIADGVIHSGSPCSTRELHLARCQLQHVQWDNLVHLQILWLEGCLDGLAESVLESLATKLPRLQELVICGTMLTTAYLPRSIVGGLSRLSVFGLIECSGAVVVNDIAPGRCVYLKTRAEFDFIKKKRWDIKWTCIPDPQ